MNAGLQPDVRMLAAQIQAALGLSIVCGSLTLNFNNGDFLTYDVKEHFRAPRDLAPQKAVDKGCGCG